MENKSIGDKTYSDLLNVKEDERNKYELIEGNLYLMAGASAVHERIVMNLGRQFGNYLKGKECFLFSSNFDIKLSEKNVYKPDLSIVCDKKKITTNSCEGPPDLIVEILSKATRKKDLGIKLTNYQKYGVKEYWIVYPNDFFITVCILDEEKKYSYFTYSLNEDEKIKVNIFNDMEIKLEDIFENLYLE